MSPCNWKNPVIVVAMDQKTRERWGAKRFKKGDEKKLLLGVLISVAVIVFLAMFAMIVSFDKANPERMDEQEYLRFITELDKVSFNASEGNQKFFMQHFALPLVKYIYFIRSDEDPMILEMIFVTKRNPICISLKYEEGLAIGEIHGIPFLVFYVEDERVLIMKFFDGETKEREFNRSTVNKVDW